jgi:sugar fermentation stimulation protein A
MLFLVQRADATRLTLARDIDPVYGEAFDVARAAGVEALAYRCAVTPEGITLERKIAVRP